ncbi:MAG: beta-galactosidase, partial [Acidobacteria bacterium]|nr:beta-galactosidase [Acidobacteriota bacterium]
MRPTRRRFLQSALGMPFVAVIGHDGAQLLRATPPSQDQELFENPHMIRYDAQCFTLEGRDTFVFSAAFHYPRCPKELWRDRLAKLQRAGFNTIETYVFWNYHERAEGQADLSEFVEFVELVKQMGFRMIARPGPYVCAEWERGGIPHWVAAKRFPLRSNHPESLRTSQHWFNQVLPVIQPRQITTGGPIIMVQIENEYDFWQLPEADKRQYVGALARMAWNAGINVPLITCWTKQARENSDLEMARIVDTCNFYPRWDIVKQVPPALQKLRQEEPTSPLGISELQGGWFSQFGGEGGKFASEEAAEFLKLLDLPQKPTLEQFMGFLSQSAGKLSVDQEGIDGAQFDALVKTAIEQGATYLNTYMAFGGTNFDWAAKTLTTTYDYAAPLREPGGLWEKYYAARGIGQTLALVGRTLPRAQLLEGVPQSANPNVSVSERVHGKSAVLFVRENSNADQNFKMTFRDPESPTVRPISVPRQGELTLGAREMKMLPVQIPITGSALRYSTAEVLAHGLIVDRHYLVVYDEPGRLAEISLATSREPSVEGDPDYTYWDPEWESVVIGVRVRGLERVFLVNQHLMLVVAPRHRALRSWTAEFPSKIIPGAEEAKPMAVPFITDAYQIGASGAGKKSIWVEFDFLPGDHPFTTLLPPDPRKCRVDGVESKFAYERLRRMTFLSLTT